MENASKALIIAGAILISILLIGIGMFLYNSAQEAINEGAGQMSEQAIQMFNSKFAGYDGTQNGSNVKSLLERAITNNAQVEDSYKVKVTYGSNADKTSSADISTIRSSIKNNSKYTVTFTYDSAGKISSIKIEVKSS